MTFCVRVQPVGVGRIPLVAVEARVVAFGKREDAADRNGPQITRLLDGSDVRVHIFPDGVDVVLVRLDVARAELGIAAVDRRQQNNLLVREGLLQQT